MNELQVFMYQDSRIRTVSIEGEPWCVVIDVCDVLEIANASDAVKRLDEDEVTRFNLGGLSGEVNLVNEAGLYTLILGSRKPEAKAFKRWITHEVIPSIRKTGQFSQQLTPAEMLLQSAQQLVDHEKQIEKLNGSVEFIKGAIMKNFDNWREDINMSLNKVSVRVGAFKFKDVRSDSYRTLEQRAHVDLNRRVDNYRTRLIKSGANMTAVKKATKLDVIDADPKLREIYAGIVRELLVKHCA